ncbi:hypothetical protein P4360_30735, partial [Bacillus thuringiensis]|nr:hypothetical protein [Bacillus thuringiensis]
IKDLEPSSCYKEGKGMRDKLLDFIIELSQSSKQVVSKSYVIDRLMQVTKEDYKELEKNVEGKKDD